MGSFNSASSQRSSLRRRPPPPACVSGKFQKKVFLLWIRLYRRVNPNFLVAVVFTYFSVAVCPVLKRSQHQQNAPRWPFKAVDTLCALFLSLCIRY